MTKSTSENNEAAIALAATRSPLGLSYRAIGALGLAFCIISVEATRLTALTLISSFHSNTLLTNLFAVLLLVGLLFVYRKRRNFSVCKSWIIIPAIFLCSVCLFLILGGTILHFSSNSNPSLVISCLYRCCTAILILAWAETLIPFGARSTLFVVALSFIFFGILQSLLVLLQTAAAIGTVALMPPVSAILLFLVRNLSLRANKQGNSKEGAESEALQNVDLSCGLASPPHHNRALFLFLSLSLTIFCNVFIFKRVHNSWLGYQDGATVSLLIQIAAAVGTMLGGLILLLIISKLWKRDSFKICCVFILPFTLIAMYLTATINGSLAPLYIIPLNIAQKLAFFLIFLAPFWYITRYNPMSFCCTALLCYRLGQATSGALDTFLGFSFLYDILVVAFVFVLIVQGFFILLARNNARSDTPSSLQTQNGTPLTKNEHQGDLEHTAAIEANHPVATVSQLDSAAIESGELLAARHTEQLIQEVADTYGLTKKEKEILALLAKGRTAAYISDSLVVSLSTVKSHMRNIYAKLEIHSQQELIDIIEDFVSKK